MWSSYKDYLQLVDENTTVYAPIAKTCYTSGDKLRIVEYEIPVTDKNEAERQALFLEEIAETERLLEAQNESD